jgi:hypothetical protein
MQMLGVLTQAPEMRSELGNQLAIQSKAIGFCPCGAVCYVEPNLPEGMIKVSLRSIGDFDTTAISKKYGGGGHKNASSFNVARSLFEEWSA